MLTELDVDAIAARDRAIEHLLALQTPAGWWKGELETNVTMDAEDLLLRAFLGIATPARIDGAARWIRRSQRSDGSWSNFFDGPADLSVTAEAYVALRLAGDHPDAAHMEKAAAFVRSEGGLGACRVFTKIWLALFGLWDWDRLPVIPPEMVLVSPRLPLSIYDFACWARQTLVALSVVSAFRPCRPIGFEVPELAGSGVGRPPERTLANWEGRFAMLGDLLSAHERLPWRPLRRQALAEAERWILHRQEADGCWGGIQPPMVYSLIALSLLGYPLSHPAIAKGLRALDDFSVFDGDEIRVEACQSPVWDTALALIALADAGVEADHDALKRAGHWLTRSEIKVKGDWAVRRPNLAPGGWAFEFHNDNYPDVDDAAEVVLALRRLGPTFGDVARRGSNWVTGMQSTDGGWAAFDADNTSEIVAKLPFCDFGEVTDPPSADVTAHVVEMLASGRANRAEMESGVEWLWRSQESDGPWFGRWGANYIYGTGAVVPALVAAGIAPSDRRLQKARRWLLDHQNPDGGWGEDLRSYVDRSWAGKGNSTASQTAWALLALIALEDRGESAQAGARYLVETQTTRRDLGRALFHRDRLPRVTSTSTTTSTAWFFP